MQLNVPTPAPLGVTVHGPPGVALAPALIENENVIEPPVTVVGVKPDPLTETWTPLGPWFGVRVIDGVVIVNGAWAESKPPSEPVANVVKPAEGPVNVTAQLNEPTPDPLPVTVQVPPGVTLAPPLIENEMVIGPPVLVVGVKPVPLTVAWVPVGPWLGVSVMAGVVILKGAWAESKLPSDPVAVTV